MSRRDSNCYFIATSWNDAPVSRHFKALADELVARGHRVVLLVDGNKSEAENHAGNPAIYTWPSRRPTKLRDARFLLRMILRHHPDCLIANFGASNIMMIVGRMLGVPCRALWYHTVSSAIELDAKVSRWKLRALRWRKRIVYAAATHIMPASKAGRDDVTRVFEIEPGKCRVFYNSLADPLEPARGRRISPQEEEYPARLVCVGRLFPTKGQDVLIRALPLLKERVPDVMIEFVGGGPDEANLRELARELQVEGHCEFVGAVAHAEVLGHISKASATVVPSRSDNNPLVVIESLALGVPIVASGVGGIIESIEDGVEGFLVPPEDPQALAEKLATLLLNPVLRREMSLNTRARFLAQFEQRRIIAEQAEWFERVTGVSKAGTLKDQSWGRERQSGAGNGKQI